LAAGAPSPVHWLLLLFACAGVILTLLMFLIDLFSGPKAPPRSYYEATLWRGKRQLKVAFVLLLALLAVGWGIALAYFVLSDTECSEQDSSSSTYKVAALLVFLLALLLFLILFLGCCVVLDFLISGRAKVVLLMKDSNPFPVQPNADDFEEGPEADPTLQPGVDNYPEPRMSTKYGTGDDSTFYVGAINDAPSRMCCDDGMMSTSFTGSRVTTSHTGGARDSTGPLRESSLRDQSMRV
jgi:hypothetical protein